MKCYISRWRSEYWNLSIMNCNCLRFCCNVSTSISKRPNSRNCLWTYKSITNICSNNITCCITVIRVIQINHCWNIACALNCHRWWNSCKHWSLSILNSNCLSNRCGYISTSISPSPRTCNCFRTCKPITNINSYNSSCWITVISITKIYHCWNISRTLNSYCCWRNCHYWYLSIIYCNDLRFSICIPTSIGICPSSCDCTSTIPSNKWTIRSSYTSCSITVIRPS